MCVTREEWGPQDEVFADHRVQDEPDDNFNANLDAWMAKSEGHRIPHSAVLRKDRDVEDVYLLMVEFSSYEIGMETSTRPETGEFAVFLLTLCDGPLQFRNLDVVREENL